MAGNEADARLKMLDRLLDTLARDEHYFSEGATCTRTNTDELVADLGWQYPLVDEQQWSRWLNRFIMAQQLPKPARMKSAFSG